MVDYSEANWLTRFALSEVLAGKIHPVIGHAFPLEQVAAAHTAIVARTVIGEILLLVTA